MKADLHIHTTASDGTFTPSELVKYAKKEKIKIFAITDHDTIDGLKDGEKTVQLLNTYETEEKNKIKFVKGIEISTIAKKDGYTFKAHILGYNINPDSSYMKEVLRKGREKRAEKLILRLGYLKDKFGICFPEDEEIKLKSIGSVGKLHLANLLIKYNYADDIQGAIKKYLGKDLPDSLTDSFDAINAINKSGGISVFAHPFGGEGETHISHSELVKRIDMFYNMGISGIECYYSRYNLEEVNVLKAEALKRRLLISGGSDFHGSNKTVKIANLNSEGIYVDSEELTVLNKISG